MLAPELRFPAGGTLARISGNNALVNLACGAGGATCDGTVSIQSAEAKGAHAAASGRATVTTYASATFSLAAGAQKAIKTQFSQAGKTLARHHRSVKVWINVTLKDSTTVTSHQVTLRF
ncbi:MAG: hypothetical protein ACLP01_21840 [Solirubrobacteraceae bacterium]